MTDVRAGQVSNVISARSDSSLRAESKTDVEILAPGLKVAMTGSQSPRFIALSCASS